MCFQTAPRLSCRRTIRYRRLSMWRMTCGIRSCISPLPVRRPGEIDAERQPSVDALARHAVRQEQIRSVTAGDAGTSDALLEVGALRTRLLVARDITPAYACVPLTRVVELRSDKQVVLDDGFMPTVLHVRTAARLVAFATELVGLFHQRGEHLASRVAGTGKAAAAADVRLSPPAASGEPAEP